MGLVVDLAGSFVLGLLTPLTAVCVLPLYPGFLAYLSQQATDNTPVSFLGVAVTAGVVAFMFGVGLVFTTVLEVSLTRVIGIVSPIAFGVLALVSVLLLLNLDVGRSIPAIEPPTTRYPVASAFSYGFFFGAIVIPCNPAFIAVFFARSFLFSNPIANVLQFLAFGVGIGFPLLALSVVSQRWSRRILRALTSHSGLINRGSGAIMLVVSLYYLFVVFDVLGGLRP